jgi:serine/threonine protein kinase
MLRGGKPLFSANSNPDQLVQLIKILGTPSSDQVKKMNPNYPYKDIIKVKPAKLESHFPALTPESAINLVFCFLKYDPVERLSAI